MSWTIEMMLELMQRFKVNQKELAAGIGVKEHSISLALSGRNGVSKYSAGLTEYYNRIKRQRIQETAQDARLKISEYEKPITG